MIDGKYCCSCLILFFLFALSTFVFPAVERDTQPVIEHIPITNFFSDDILEIRASVQEEVEWMRFFFRCGLEEFQVREMTKMENGSYVFELDTSVFPELEFVYYLEAQKEEVKNHYPEGAPIEFITAVGQSEEPMPDIPEDFPPPEEEEKKFKLPLSINGSIETLIAQKESIEGEVKTNASGNLSVFHNYSKEDFMIDFDSNFSYTNTPFEGEKNFDLSNMMLSISKANHTLRVGDINISESEYSVFGLGRRGFEYLFDNQEFYVHLFDVSSQQPMGFKGFGIPKSNISILGGTFGYNFKNAFSLKAIFLTGKDNPDEGVSIGFSEELESREGSVIAFVHEGSFFNNIFSTNAEFARSSYDGELEDEKESIAGNAFNLGGGIMYGQQAAINIGARYNYIGKDFNSIGYQYMTNDRKGYESNLGFTYKILNISVSYMASQDNAANDPSEFTTKDKNFSGNLSFNFSDKVFLSLGYRGDKQNTLEGVVETFIQDSLVNEFMGNLSVYFSPDASLDISITNSELSSESEPDNVTSTFTLNIGGNARKGEKISINPSIGYSKMINKFLNERTKTFNTFLSTEINFFPQVFSLNFSGAYNRTEVALFDPINALDLGVGINLYLDKLIRIGSLVLTLNGSYQYNESAGISDSDYRVLLQCNFAF